MDVKCGNCGQFISDTDRYCKYCSAPNAAEKKEEPKPTKKTLQAKEDQKQLEKTLISEADYEGAGVFEDGKIVLTRVGTIGDLKRRSIFTAATAAVLGIVCAVGALLTVTVWQNGQTLVKVLVGVVLLLLFVFGVAVVFDRFNAIKTYLRAEVKEKSIVFGSNMKKLPYALYDGELYRIDIEENCPVCAGDENQTVKGRLHIENIEARYIAVCDYNRKHFQVIDTDSIFERLKKGAPQDDNLTQS